MIAVDQQQREEAIDPARSFIVEAPAGSGKTALLVKRFLRLLSVVERPESVVAMTFTRKAAAEMKKRVMDALTNANPVNDFQKETRRIAEAVLDQDRRQRWNLIEDPSRLQIQTIDSLCALLTRQMPVLSEFGGFGEVMEEVSDLYLRAAREMLTNLAEGDENSRGLFRRMILHFDNDVSRLEGHVVKMLSKRDQWQHLNPTSDAQLIKDCYAILKRAEDHLRLVFQRTGKVDFTEISRAARRALGKPEHPSDLLYSLDYRLQHLLVDEFQDTSRSQYELVKALTEQWSLDDDHTLFLVGDPMQSIYRFREADVSLFLKCWRDERIGAVRLTPIRLRTNFRSTAQILQWVETNFAPMMPNDDQEQGAVEFRRSFSGRDGLGLQPRLIAHIEDKGVEEAGRIVDIIQSNPGRNVAILVRSRGQVVHILPALRKAGVAYEAVDIDALRDQQHIIDLLSLTRALTNVADRVAWLACLRAPWCGLTLMDLSLLAEGKRDQTILDLLSDPETIAGLTVDGRRRAIRAQEILTAGVEQVGRLSVRDMVEQTWHALGGLAVIQEANQHEDINTFFGLMDQADEGGVIRDFSLLNKKLEFLYARPSATGSKVAIMTIYQAKGLEFDIVILPQLGTKVRGYENELLVWTERGGELSVAALPATGKKNPDYDEITNIAKERDENETKRVFYVACTRAIDELHLIGSAGRKKGGAECATPSSGTFLRLMWDAVRPEFDEKLRHGFNVQPDGRYPAANRSPLRRLPLDWHAPALAPSIKIAAPMRRAVASQLQVSYRWVGDTSRHAGTVVHEVLKRIASDGLEQWTVARVLALRDYIGAELLRLGVPGGKVPEAAKQVLLAVSNTLSSQRGRWILAPHNDARAEWAVAGRVNQSLVSGTVDRAFLDERSGDYWIIDFKNSDHSGTGLDKFLSNEKERYQPQLEQYAAVISRLVKGPIRLGLYFPLLDQWVEWQFAEAAAAAN